MPAPPVVLTIAGSDSSGGAGIQADLKTFTRFRVYGASALTALTAQNTTGVQGIHAVPASFVALQIASVADDLAIAAAKTGMLANAEIVAEVANWAETGRLGQLVIDPVMVATSGDALIDAAAVAVMKKRLFPHAALITPNLAEAARLCDAAPAASIEEMAAQARLLCAGGAKAVLVKGGHLGAVAQRPREAIDVLARVDGISVLRGAWVESPNTHGTGCTLSAAIAANLALGRDLAEAVAVAKRFVGRAVARAAGQRLGAGSGPLNHLDADTA